MSITSERVSFTSGIPVPPRVATKIVGKKMGGPLMPERFIISGAGTAGGAADWIVNDIEIDGTSQLSMKDLSGALFGSRGVVSGEKASSAIHFAGLDVIEQESEVSVTITYVGPNPEGVPFFGSIVGDAPPQRQTVLPFATKGAVLITQRKEISLNLDAVLKIEQLEISNEGTAGGAADWIVNDLRVEGASQFPYHLNGKKAGDIPGDLFATNVIDRFVKFQPGKQIEIDVTYIGLNEAGARFVGHFLGTVVRDNYNQPPPDVRAIVRTSGEGDLGEEVIARCNWRPYVPPSAP